jgi:hypothetical protein
VHLVCAQAAHWWACDATMPGMGHDGKFLQELVGDALARGVASTISSQPNDPVDYLGQWLLR